VVGHPQSDFQFAVTFPFHPSKDGKGAEVTVIREYAQVRLKGGRGVSGARIGTGGGKEEQPWQLVGEWTIDHVRWSILRQGLSVGLCGVSPDAF
jgi:hypothetical protein